MCRWYLIFKCTVNIQSLLTPSQCYADFTGLRSSVILNTLCCGSKIFLFVAPPPRTPVLEQLCQQCCMYECLIFQHIRQSEFDKRYRTADISFVEGIPFSLQEYISPVLWIPLMFWAVSSCLTVQLLDALTVDTTNYLSVKCPHV